MKNLTKNKLRNRRPFDDARNYARSLKLKSREEWFDFARGKRPELGKKPDDIPTWAREAYIHSGWCGYRDWLGLPAKRWRSYTEARRFVRNLGLQTIGKWRLYCSGKFNDDLGIKPGNIPSAPNIVYEDKGWLSWGDFLGYGTVLSVGKAYDPFIHARNYVRSLNLKSQAEWFALCNGKDIKLGDLYIPIFPNTVYRERGWTSWKNWLGLTARSPNWSYEQARDFARKLSLKNVQEWRKYRRGELINRPPLPDAVTVNPQETYKDKGWISWGDFLGTGQVATSERKYKTFEEAREFARALKLKSEPQWRTYCKGELPEKGVPPDDIPSFASRHYKDKGWVSWGDFLGTGRVAHSKRKFRSFKKSRKFVRALKLKSRSEWNRYCKGEMPELSPKPTDIPVNPYRSYPECQGMGDWLGTGAIANQKKKYLPFQQARNFVRKFKFRNVDQWRKYCKIGEKPDNIPACPDIVYKDKGWISYGDFLGTGYVHSSENHYLSFEEVKKFVRAIGIKNHTEWRSYIKGEIPELPPKPSNIPSNLNICYKNKGWISWGDFFGTGYVAVSKRKFKSFEEARKFIRALKLKNKSEWLRYCKGEILGLPTRPTDIPTNPHRTYRSEWQGVSDWLGICNSKK